MSDDSDVTITPKPGDVVYLRDGTAMRYLGEMQGQHFANRLVQAMEMSGNTVAWAERELVAVSLDSLLLDPPTAVLGERIAELRGEIATVEAELAVTRDAARVELEQINTLREASKYLPDLQLVFDWIEGRITHVVCYFTVSPDGVIGMAPPPAIMKVEDIRHPKYKQHGQYLASLFGHPGGALRFGRVYYEDYSEDRESGGHAWFIPCRSYRDAEAWLEERFQADLTRWRNARNGNRREILEGWDTDKCAIKVSLPDEYLEEKAAALEARRRARIDYYVAALKDLGMTVVAIPQGEKNQQVELGGQQHGR